MPGKTSSITGLVHVPRRIDGDCPYTGTLPTAAVWKTEWNHLNNTYRELSVIMDLKRLIHHNKTMLDTQSIAGLSPQYQHWSENCKAFYWSRRLVWWWKELSNRQILLLSQRVSSWYVSARKRSENEDLRMCARRDWETDKYQRMTVFKERPSENDILQDLQIWQLCHLCCHHEWHS